MTRGTGWLGWTEEQTLNTSLDVIVDAYEARIEMISFMTGKPAPQTVVPEAPPASTPMTPELFMTIFGNQKK